MQRTDDIEVIRGEAERWFACLRSGRCSAAERSAFNAWIGVEAHAAAYSETQQLWGDMETLGDNADVRQWLDESRQLDRPPDTLRPRRWAWLSASAAAAVLVCLGGWYAMQPSLVARYATAHGEQRHFTLDDGSQLILNTDTAIDVRFDRRTRVLQLEKGEASFEVAHEAGRSFVVNAGGSAITDLGTRFIVHKEDAQTVVSVVEGAVEVAHDGHETAKLAVGEQLAISGNDWQKRSVDLALVSGWTQGKLVFRATPLAEVVAQANRYGPGRLVIADASLDAYKISGEFRIGNNDALVRALQSAFPIQAESADGETRLRRR